VKHIATLLYRVSITIDCVVSLLCLRAYVDGLPVARSAMVTLSTVAPNHDSDDSNYKQIPLRMRKIRTLERQLKRPRRPVRCSGCFFHIGLSNLSSDIHIRIQQRNGRKTLTTIEGIPSKFDLKKILKVIKKQFACNGTIVNDEKAGDVIQLQGDQRNAVKDFLVDKDKGLEIDPKTIKVHGF
jgi:translation initiation factor 1